MIQKGTSRKILLVFLVVLLLVFLGVSVFIATQLQQNQAPPSSSACTWVTTANCGSGCLDYFQSRPACCTNDTNDWGLPVCTTQPGSQSGCRAVYSGTTFRLEGDGCTNVTIQKCSTSYSGVGSKCPVNNNCINIGKGSNGATYTANPTPGECVQIDHIGASETPNGGVCDCNPPTPQNPTATAAATCPVGSTIPVATLTWNLGGYPAQNVRVDISTSSTFTSYFSKNVNSGTTSTDSTGFTNGSSTLTLASNTTYYVRVHLNTSNVNTATTTFSTANCTVDQPTVTAASQCPEGSLTPTATLTWDLGGYSAQNVRVDISTTSDFASYWSKDVSSGILTTDASGFTGAQGQGALTLNSATTYYIRIRLKSSEVNSPVSSFNAATCHEVSAQCIDLAESGSDPIASGAGNYVEYTLTYQNQSSSNPYPNIKLRVGPTSAPVGRDALHTSSTLVEDYDYINDPVTHTHTYKFRWEAASTAGVGVPAGTYEVRVLLDGSSGEVTSPTACLESITVSQSVTPEPLFNIVKTGAVVCESDGDARIDYTITATNIGSVTGVLDFVEDNYDATAVSLGITPTNITPSYGTIGAGGKISWIGDTSARTYTAGQNKQFNYSLTIPLANLLTFSSTGVSNQAKLQYDTSVSQDNSVTFDLRTLLTCSTPSIPNTGIFDDARLLFIGMVLILAGVVVYKSKIGYQFSERIVGSMYDSINESIKDTKLPFKPYEENILDDMDNKIRGGKKRKPKKK